MWRKVAGLELHVFRVRRRFNAEFRSCDGVTILVYNAVVVLGMIGLQVAVSVQGFETIISTTGSPLL